MRATSPEADRSDLLIVGGGASGTALLQSLAARRTERGGSRVRVALLERSSVLGRGLPYGEAAAPFHTMGRTQTRRHEKGAQLEDRFARAVVRLRESGVEVVVRSGVTAIGLERSAGAWRVDTDAGSVMAPIVALTTGHWHVPRLAHLRRVVDWRWDVRRLHSVISDADDVVVLGMGQSGLDVALALGERRLCAQSPGRITLASRYGLLPGVFGHVSARGAAEVTRNLEALRTAPDVTLEQLVGAARMDAIAVAGEAKLPSWDLEALQRFVAERDGVTRLREDVEVATRSRLSGVPIPWQPVLWHGLPHFHALFPRLSAEDRLVLAAWSTPIMRQVEAIHLGTASRLLELIDRGLVTVRALGGAPNVSEDADRVQVRGSRAAVDGAYLVDARGPDGRIHLSDDAFLKSVLGSGAAVAGRVPFRGEPPASVPEAWSVEARSGRDWLVTGGLWVDPEDFAVRDANSQRSPGLYALGPLTVGQFPFYAGLWAGRRAADAVVAACGW